jgi:hypothetical protein
MSPPITEIIEKLENLPSDRQQHVLELINFLLQSPVISPSKSWPHEISALEAAGDIVGCVTGAAIDLSTNPDHLKDFGKA